MIKQDVSPQEDLLLKMSLVMGVALGLVAAAITLLMLLVMSVRLDLNLDSSLILARLPAAWQAVLAREALVMGFPLQQETSAYWYMSRASGMLAYLLLWAASAWGLILSSKIVKDQLSPALTFGLHEFLSWLGLGFAAFHALILLGDRYINFNLAAILLPFQAPYQPLWTGIGSLSLYLYALLVLSFYLRKQIGRRTWRAIHYLTFALYAAVLSHSLILGSDNGSSLIRAGYWFSGAAILFLIYYRWLSRALNRPQSHS